MPEDYFVQIKDPADIRRSILGSSKQIIHILQRYERMKDLRVQKLEKISKLRAQNKEINLLVAKLQKEFPAAKLRVPLSSDSGSRRGYKGDDLAQLEADLRKIENKIGNLS